MHSAKAILLASTSLMLAAIAAVSFMVAFLAAFGVESVVGRNFPDLGLIHFTAISIASSTGAHFLGRLEPESKNSNAANNLQ